MLFVTVGDVHVGLLGSGIFMFAVLHQSLLNAEPCKVHVCVHTHTCKVSHTRPEPSAMDIAVCIQNFTAMLSSDIQ